MKTKAKKNEILFLSILISVVMIFTLIPSLSYGLEGSNPNGPLTKNTTSYSYDNVERELEVIDIGTYRFAINQTSRFKIEGISPLTETPYMSYSSLSGVYYLNVTFNSPGTYRVWNSNNSTLETISVSFLHPIDTINLESTIQYNGLKTYLNVSTPGTYTFIHNNIKGFSIDASEGTFSYSGILADGTCVNAYTFASPGQYLINGGAYTNEAFITPETITVKSGLPLTDARIDTPVRFGSNGNIAHSKPQVWSDKLISSSNYTVKTAVSGNNVTYTINGKGKYFGTILLKKKVKVLKPSSVTSGIMVIDRFLSRTRVLLDMDGRELAKLDIPNFKIATNKKTGVTTFKWKYNKKIMQYEYKYRIKNKAGKKYGKWTNTKIYKQSSKKKLTSVKLPKLKKGQTIQVAIRYTIGYKVGKEKFSYVNKWKSYSVKRK